MTDYVETKFGEFTLSLHLPTLTVRSFFSSNRPQAVFDAFLPDGNQPPAEVLAYTKALLFAARAHASIDQRRRYTNEPYIVHPIAVAEIVRSVPHTSDMIAAALLHDTLEDTPTSHGQIKAEFGDEVADLVYWLTNFSSLEDGNRAVRKAMDVAYIAVAPAAAKTIKIADLIDNTKTIKERDPDFWKVYRREKQRLLEVLREGDATLWAIAAKQCEEE